MRTLVLLAALAACLPAHAVNRCVLPSGRVTYTDAACESIGAKLQREVRTGPAPAVPASQPRAATGPVTHPLCYDGTNARPEINSAEVESVLRSGAAAWNGGCRIRFEYVGACTGAADAYRITWISFDPGLQFDGKSIREHAVAAANLLAARLATGANADDLLEKVQDRRMLPVKLIQGGQKLVHDRILTPLVVRKAVLDSLAQHWRSIGRRA